MPPNKAIFIIEWRRSDIIFLPFGNKLIRSVYGESKKLCFVVPVWI